MATATATATADAPHVHLDTHRVKAAFTLAWTKLSRFGRRAFKVLMPVLGIVAVIGVILAGLAVIVGSWWLMYLTVSYFATMMAVPFAILVTLAVWTVGGMIVGGIIGRLAAVVRVFS